MKGVSVKTLQSTVSKFLDKVEQLLTTEPVRLIGYGAAAVIYLAARVLADRGYLNVPLSAEDSLTAALAAVGIVLGIVESMRRFVISPQTYIENLSDEAQAAHEAAHMEEAYRAFQQAVAAEAEVKTRKRPVVVGTAKPAGSTDQSN